MKVVKSDVIHDYLGVIEGECVAKSAKLYKDAKSFYRNPEDLSDETVMYHVYSVSKGEKRAGNLNWGLTVLYPVSVNGECNMTRGHWHENRDCVEFYYGAAGHGLLLLMDEEGNTWAEEVCQGSLHYIDGHLAHRLINTGEEVMKVIACWPADSGHDYAAVENMPFGYRVYKKNGMLEFVKEEKKNEE